MLIKDIEDKYEIKVDLERSIVYEKNIGLWTKEDFNRFRNEYSTKILPALSGREWFKYCDISEYELSEISQELNEFVSWCAKNKMFGGLIIVKSNLVEMQINISALYAGVKFGPVVFCNKEDADKWLSSHWI